MEKVKYFFKIKKNISSIQINKNERFFTLFKLFNPRFVFGYLLGFSCCYYYQSYKINKFLEKRNEYINNEINKAKNNLINLKR